MATLLPMICLRCKISNIRLKRSLKIVQVHCILYASLLHRYARNIANCTRGARKISKKADFIEKSASVFIFFVWLGNMRCKN